MIKYGVWGLLRKTRASPRLRSYVCSDWPTEVVIWKVVLPSGIDVKGTEVGETSPMVLRRMISTTFHSPTAKALSVTWTHSEGGKYSRWLSSCRLRGLFTPHIELLTFGHTGFRLCRYDSGRHYARRSTTPRSPSYQIARSKSLILLYVWRRPCLDSLIADGRMDVSKHLYKNMHRGLGLEFLRYVVEAALCFVFPTEKLSDWDY